MTDADLSAYPASIADWVALFPSRIEARNLSVSGSNLEVQTNIDPINLVFTIVNNNESIATFGMLLVQANP